MASSVNAGLGMRLVLLWGQDPFVVHTELYGAGGAR